MNKLIFLGTGNSFNYTSQQTSLCFVNDSGAVLIDCGDGMGTLRNLITSGVKLEIVNDIFLTHKHADHIMGLPFILLNKTIKEKSKIRVMGPPQTVISAERMCLETSFIQKNHQTIAFIPIKPNENLKPIAGITVTGFHMADIPGRRIEEYAYEVNMNEKKIVFSADTNVNHQFVTFAQNADILIHECGGLDAERERINRYGHSTAKDAAVCAQKSCAKQLILTHLPDDTQVRHADLLNEARQYYSGHITIAEDLMMVEL